MSELGRAALSANHLKTQLKGCLRDLVEAPSSSSSNGHNSNPPTTITVAASSSSSSSNSSSNSNGVYTTVAPTLLSTYQLCNRKDREILQRYRTLLKRKGADHQFIPQPSTKKNKAY